MATQPDPSPDSVEPQSPDEIPGVGGDPEPQEAPVESPNLTPDSIEPAQTPDETPANPDSIPEETPDNPDSP